ncbi:helix-turn-helix domain-containing protein [Patulibacter defluvii]|uniref:helix-turn-helix domain-containing protein n=1 Tax=Patulibacter defluvii TaxID=3095358 RepID=UPI002A7580E6|nr:helix-turn-helix domain-containing protein [Patulibacter sp. DM4]
MAEIGATLREARMRAGIDIAEVEARTKIRAKYLRALENEEWSLLPGSTFVKSFLRTYAEALGLDAKLLVEEYKFRHEPYEGAGAGVRRGPRRSGGGGGGGAFGPPKRTNWVPLLLLVVLVGVALFAVYRLSQGEDQPPSTTTVDTTQADARAAAERKKRADERRRARERRAAARLIVPLRVQAGPSTPVFVCVVDAQGKRVVNGRELAVGQRTKLLRSKRFRIALNDASARVTVGGRRRNLTAGSDGVVAYEITRNASKRLPAGRRPSCS